jgi:hypothetical protein
LRERGGAALENVQFLAGDSLETLPAIAARHERIDFALVGSAPSATHTLREFFALEARLGPGARLLVDEAALPGARLTLGPCRKGALLVPYLLASPVWRVTAHPRAGESMVSAVYDRVGARADARYEDPRLADSWRAAPVCPPDLLRAAEPWPHTPAPHAPTPPGARNEPGAPGVRRPDSAFAPARREPRPAP